MNLPLEVVLSEGTQSDGGRHLLASKETAATANSSNNANANNKSKQSRSNSHGRLSRKNKSRSHQNRHHDSSSSSSFTTITMGRSCGACYDLDAKPITKATKNFLAGTFFKCFMGSASSSAGGGAPTWAFSTGTTTDGDDEATCSVKSSSSSASADSVPLLLDKQPEKNKVVASNHVVVAAAADGGAPVARDSCRSKTTPLVADKQPKKSLATASAVAPGPCCSMTTTLAVDTSERSSTTARTTIEKRLKSSLSKVAKQQESLGEIKTINSDSELSALLTTTAADTFMDPVPLRRINSTSSVFLDGHSLSRSSTRSYPPTVHNVGSFQTNLLANASRTTETVSLLPPKQDQRHPNDSKQKNNSSCSRKEVNFSPNTLVYYHEIDWAQDAHGEQHWALAKKCIHQESWDVFRPIAVPSKESPSDSSVESFSSCDEDDDHDSFASDDLAAFFTRGFV